MKPTREQKAPAPTAAAPATTPEEELAALEQRRAALAQERADILAQLDRLDVQAGAALADGLDLDDLDAKRRELLGKVERLDAGLREVARRIAAAEQRQREALVPAAVGRVAALDRENDDDLCVAVCAAAAALVRLCAIRLRCREEAELDRLAAGRWRSVALGVDLDAKATELQGLIDALAASGAPRELVERARAAGHLAAHALVPLRPVPRLSRAERQQQKARPTWRIRWLPFLAKPAGNAHLKHRIGTVEHLPIDQARIVIDQGLAERADLSTQELDAQMAAIEADLAARLGQASEVA